MENQACVLSHAGVFDTMIAIKPAPHTQIVMTQVCAIASFWKQTIETEPPEMRAIDMHMDTLGHVIDGTNAPDRLIKNKSCWIVGLATHTHQTQ